MPVTTEPIGHTTQSAGACPYELDVLTLQLGTHPSPLIRGPTIEMGAPVSVVVARVGISWGEREGCALNVARVHAQLAVQALSLDKPRSTYHMIIAATAVTGRSSVRQLNTPSAAHLPQDCGVQRASTGSTVVPSSCVYASWPA